MIALGNEAGLFGRRLEPVFGAKTFDTLELAEVAGNDDKAAAAGVAGDEDVVGADHLAAAFEIGVDFPRVGGCVLVERQDRKPGCKAFDALSGFYGTGGLGRAVQQFGKGDGGYAERVRLGVEARTQALWAVTQQPDAEVGVEHVAQHQKVSRTCCSGWARSPRSTAGPAKKSSHMEDAGTITRRIPSRMIATSRTPGGNATSFDRRTACERLLWNKVVRFICSTVDIPYVYPD